jgi:hypothetical protein
MYMIKIQTFIFDEEKGIFVAWVKLKEYCRKVIAANPNLKMTYPDAALFLILSRSLLSSFKLLTHAFVAQPTLSIEEKIDMLVEYKMNIRDEELNTEKAHIAKSKSKVSKHCHCSSNSDSDEDNLINCYLCNGDHAFRFCSHVKLAGKLLKCHFC